MSRPPRDPSSLPAVSITDPNVNPGIANRANTVFFGSLQSSPTMDINMVNAWGRSPAYSGLMPHLSADGTMGTIAMPRQTPGLAMGAHMGQDANQGSGSIAPHRVPSKASLKATGQEGLERFSKIDATDPGSSTVDAAADAISLDSRSGPSASNPQGSDTSGPRTQRKKTRGRKSRAKAEPSSEVIDITSSEYEDDGARYLPGDSTYRGRAQGSRVKPRASDGPKTRSKAAKEGDGLIAPTPEAHSPTHRSAADDVHGPLEHSSIRGDRKERKKNKRVKSSAMVVSSSSSEYDGEAALGPPFTQARNRVSPESNGTSNSPQKRSRSAGRLEGNSSADDTRPKKKAQRDVESDVEGSGLSESEWAALLGGIVKRHRKAGMSAKDIKRRLNAFVSSTKRWRSAFLDLEAVEDDGCTSDSSMDIDHYDTSDSFIDDSPEVPPTSTSKKREKIKVRASTSEIMTPGPRGHRDGDDMQNTDGELPTPGLEFEDFARHHREMVATQVEEDGHIAKAIDRNQTMLALRTPPSTRATQRDNNDGEGASESSEDEYGIKHLRGQLQEAIRRSRADHERFLVQKGIWPPVMEPVPSVQDLLRMYPSPSTPGPSGPPSSSPSIATPASRSVANVLQTPTRGTTTTVDHATSGRVEAPSFPAPQTLPPPTPTGSSRRPRGRRPLTLPAACEVTDPALQDPILQKDYDHLPKLTAGQFIPWSNIPGPGQARFSAWPEQCPEMNMELALRAIRFSLALPFINPSRGCPTAIDVREITAGAVSHSRRYHAYLDGTPAIFVSSIFSELSKLRETTQHGLPQNMLQGKFHTQEWDRFVAFVCMVFGKRELYANLARDSMHFVTRALSNDASAGAASGGMFSKVRSSSTKRSGSTRIVADNFALDTNNNVPIYDARGIHDFDFDKDLPSLSTKLPAWNEEIPPGSFVVVGYTAAVYLSNLGKWSLSCNIQWVIVIGIPEGNDGDDL